MTWRLGLRLARGGDRAGVVRLALLSAGIAAAVFVLLCSTALPRALEGQAQRSADRLVDSPLPGKPGAFLARTVPDQLDGRPFTSVVIAVLSPQAPSPPGLSRPPSPGEVFVSPAVAALGRGSDGRIGPAGLAAPDELFEYRGVAPEAFADEASPAVGFGGPAYLVERPPVSRVSLMLLLLVGLPAAVFLATSARLSSATRHQRLAVLRLLGLRPREVVRIAAVETGVAGAAGAAGGLLLYVLLLPSLAASSVLGVTWFPSDSRLTPAGAVVVLASTVAVSAVLGSRGMARVLDRPLEARRESEARTASWKGWALLASGVVVLCAFAVLPIAGRRPSLGSGPAFQFVLAATALSIAGCALLLRSALASIARRLGDSPSLSRRLAGRRLAIDGASTARVLTGLVVLCLVAGGGSGALRDAELTTNPPTQRSSVAVATSASLGPGGTDRLLALPAKAVVAVSDLPVFRDGQPARLPVVVATCAAVEAIAKVVEGSCRQGRVHRLRSEVFSDEPLRGLTLDPGAPAQDEALVVADALPFLPTQALLVTDIASVTGRWAPYTSLLLVGANPEAADGLRAAVRAIDPTAQALGNVDPVAQANYQLLSRTGRTSVLAGFALAVLTFVVAAVDRAQERRGNVVALSVVGVPIRQLRRIQVLQLLVPLAAVLGAALAVGNLIGLAWIGAGGLEQGLYLGGLRLTAAMLVLSLILAVAAGRLTVRRRLATEHLRRV